MSLRMAKSPNVPGERAASCELCLLFIHRLLGSIETFSGGVFFLVGGGAGGKITWEDSMEEFFMGEGNFP